MVTPAKSLEMGQSHALCNRVPHRSTWYSLHREGVKVGGFANFCVERDSLESGLEYKKKKFIVDM